MDKIKKQQILIVGFGYRTGLATANYLLKKGISISISDSKSEQELFPLIKVLPGQPQNFFFGKQNSSVK